MKLVSGDLGLLERKRKEVDISQGSLANFCCGNSSLNELAKFKINTLYPCYNKIMKKRVKFIE